MQVKKLKVKKKIKISLYVVLGIILILLVYKGFNTIKENIKRCDDIKNHPCTLYELQQYIKSGE